MPTLNKFQVRYFTEPGLTHVRSMVKEQYGQTGDRVTPLPYKLIKAESSGFFRDKSSGWAYGAIDAPNTRSLYDYQTYSVHRLRAENQARSAFISQLRQGTSQLAVAAAEFQQSLGLITSTGLSLYQLYSDIRHGNWDRLKHRFVGKGDTTFSGSLVLNALDSASAGWLTYWFGVSATLADAHGALAALTSPIPMGRLEGRGFNSFSVSEDYGSWQQNCSATIRSVVGADVVVSNPNMFLRESLGLLNPATVAWELAPWSFVVDWMYDFGGLLSSLTDLAGVQVLNGYTSSLMRFSDSLQIDPQYVTGGPAQCQGAMFTRAVGVPAYVPTFEVGLGLSNNIPRALSAWSLATQSLVDMISDS